MKKFYFAILFFLGFTTLLFNVFGCGNRVNTNFDNHFEEDGRLKVDTTSTVFEIQTPSSVKFFVEVSGSMNGFFRANRPTHFKVDLWNILNYYSPISTDVCIITNDGSEGASYELQDFRTMMNGGKFVSTASTKVPLMLKSIVGSLDIEAGEVAVLVSDMKYSPVGSASPDVLLSQYSTDISRILGDFGGAVCLIGATSNFLDKKGNETCMRSPYYYLVIGKAEHVADIRNGISTLLLNNGHFVDNIESGFDYGKPKYYFGVYNKCSQFDESEPTFVQYEEADEIDTCFVNLKVNLEDYRWIMADENVFRESFRVKSIYDSEISVGDVAIDVANINEDDKSLRRKVVANVELRIFNMPTDSDVLEWTLEIPDTNYTLFGEFFMDAQDENDVSKSYSLLEFVKGMFYGGVVNKKLGNNYILISKKG